jgi:recombination protein U
MSIKEWRTETQTQPVLPGQKKSASKSNLGKSFEMLLETTHHNYRVKKIASISRNPVEWVYCDRKTYEYLKRAGGDLTAQTATGRYIKKVSSAVDFSGVALGGRHIEFDCKQFQNKSFPLANVKSHQLRRIVDAAACGSISGLMLYFSDLNRVFFVRAVYVAECVNEMLLKNGKKSISLAQCETNGVEIPVKNGLVDYLAVLVF